MKGGGLGWGAGWVEGGGGVGRSNAAADSWCC